MFSTFLEWVACKVTRLSSITHYLDDFLLVGPANSESCSQALTQFKDFMSHFGVPLSPEKTIGPVPVIAFLGIEIDSVAMEFRLPQDKIAKLLYLIEGCLLVVQMQSLLGSLNFACKIMSMGRIFSRRLILATRGVRQLHHRIRITAPLRSDLIMWQRFLNTYNGKTCFQEEDCDSHSLGLTFGPAGPVGFSVRFKDQKCVGTWPESWVGRAWPRDPILTELFPLAAAMELWGQLFCNKCIRLQLRTDSATHAINFLSSSSLPVIKIGFIVLRCLEFNVWMKASVGTVWSAPEGTTANSGMPSFGLGCLGELIPLIRSSIAPSTWRAYGKAWDEWCSLAADKPVGTSDSLRVQVTLAFLASGVSGAVARNRISGVVFHFKLRGWSDSTKHFLIGQVLKGWRRVSARNDQRRPISFPLLANLVKASGNVCDSVYEATLISAAFSLAFFGAIRVSEILPSSRHRAGGLQLDDIEICDNGLRVRVRRSKTDQEDGMRPSIWLVGHSYIYWAARRAELCPGGRSLGFTGMDVIWRGTRGLTWSQVLPEVVRIVRVASSPTVVVIHAGGNDLASFPLTELLTLMRANLDKFLGFFPVMRLVWSELIPRLVWRGARELSDMERSRRTLNQRISRFIRFKNGAVMGSILMTLVWIFFWMVFGKGWCRHSILWPNHSLIFSSQVSSILYPTTGKQETSPLIIYGVSSGLKGNLSPGSDRELVYSIIKCCREALKASLMFFGALRIGELLPRGQDGCEGLAVNQLSIADGSLVLYIAKSKTDQEDGGSGFWDEVIFQHSLPPLCSGDSWLPPCLLSENPHCLAGGSSLCMKSWLAEAAVVQSRSSVVQSRSAVVQSRSAVVQSRSAVVQSRSAVVQSRSAVVQSRSSVVQSRSSVVQSRSSVVQSRSAVVQSRSAVVQSRSAVVQSRSAVVQSRSAVVQSRSAVVQSRSAVVQSRSAVVQSRSAVVQSRSSVVQSRSSVVQSRSSVVQSRSAVVQSRSAVVQSRSAVVQSRSAVVQSRSAVVQS
ncbi:unnamed protein product [Ranitomeya imitator]|uniref:Reverse transcriptase domain-containing protein n=1 Tax=Ranitomeya imitator TaxID=111125 RepID=A0ABN9LT27_9NEOB|nr:unnamed protein product [Ranitomeya imitator]